MIQQWKPALNKQIHCYIAKLLPLHGNYLIDINTDILVEQTVVNLFNATCREAITFMRHVCGICEWPVTI